MAKYKVLKKFRDKETREVYELNTEIEMTVKRADEVEKNLDGSFLERIDNKEQPKEEAKDEVKEEPVKKEKNKEE